MGVLGADFFEVNINFFEFTALFSNSHIQIFDTTYEYAEILTGFLNYVPTEYVKAVEELKSVRKKRDTKQYFLISEKLNSLIADMPLFHDFSEGRYIYLKADYGAHEMSDKLDYTAVSENELFRNFRAYVELKRDLEMIQERYAWFLTEIFHRDMGKIGSDRYAWQIEGNGMSGFVSKYGMEKRELTEPSLSVQYEVRAVYDDKRINIKEVHLCEKMTFHRLSDFIYVELFKALMQEHVPKRCKNCSRWFLQKKGFVYEYCDQPAPGETDKTCRQIGSLASFRDKVNNNEIWKAHQRAYKKYYARVLKKKMTKSEFNDWAQMAERLRDEALEKSAHPMNKFDMDKYIRDLNAL